MGDSSVWSPKVDGKVVKKYAHTFLEVRVRHSQNPTNTFGPPKRAGLIPWDTESGKHLVRVPLAISRI